MLLAHYGSGCHRSGGRGGALFLNNILNNVFSDLQVVESNHPVMGMLQRRDLSS